jgi:hypothetical protein
MSINNEVFQMPKILVINLDSRPDRWNSIKELCKLTGIEPIRVPAVKASVGWHGCGKSHVKCIKIAKNLNLPWVLVLEDDCTFTEELWKHFLTLLPILWKRRQEWNYFNGGPSYPMYFNSFDEELRLLKGYGLTTHFILYNNTIYDKVASWNIECKPIDYYFKHNILSIFGYPYVAHQLPGISDVEGKVVNFDWVFKEAEDMIKEFSIKLFGPEKQN